MVLLPLGKRLLPGRGRMRRRMAAHAGGAAMRSARASCFAALAVAFALAACAELPTGPSVLALPGSNKTLQQFEPDDKECRAYAAQRLPPADASTNFYDLQRRYDFAFIQCMYSKGHRVPVPADYTSGPLQPPPATPPSPRPAPVPPPPK